MTDHRAPEETTLKVHGLPSPATRWSVQCLNCEAPLSGPFCATCGQRAVPSSPTVREVVGDAFSELIGWDGKFAESLRTLFAKPGELTRRWIEGKRVSFISPLRLYLTASLVYFVVVAAAPSVKRSATGQTEVNVEGLRIGVGKTPGKAERVSSQASAAIETNKPLTGAERDAAIADIATAPAFLRPMLTRAIDEPQAFTTAVRRAMPNVFLALVPVLGLVLAVFYRRRHYPEHLFFATHLMAFVFLARTAGNLALFTRSLVVAAVVQGIVLIWIAAYGVIALRRVYGGSVLMTILKGIGICLLYALVATPVILGVALWAAS